MTVAAAVRSDRGQRVLLWIVGVLGVVRATTMAIGSLSVDEREHIHAAWLVFRGGVPYRDFFEHHHATLWYALAGAAKLVGSTDGTAIIVAGRALTALAFLAGLALVLRLARHFPRGAAPCIGLFYVTQAATYFFEIRPEALAVPAALYLLIVLLDGADRLTRRRLLAVAATAALMLALTPRSLGLLAPYGATVWFVWRRFPWRLAIALAIGATVGLAIAVALAGGLHTYVGWVFTFSSQLAPRVPPTFFELDEYVLAPCAAILAKAIADGFAQRPTRAQLAAHLLFVASVALMLLERRIFDHSFVFVFATGLWSLLASFEQLHTPRQRVGLGLALAVWYVLLAWSPQYTRGYGRPWGELPYVIGAQRVPVVDEVRGALAKCAAPDGATIYITQAMWGPFCARDAAYYWFGETLITGGTPLPADAPSLCDELTRLSDHVDAMEHSVVRDVQYYCARRP